MPFESKTLKDSGWVLLLAAQFLGSCLTQPAFGIVLAWDPSPDANVAGYAVRYGTNSGSYPMRVDVANQTNATILLPTDGAAYFFVVTAYTLDGLDSLPSNEVSYVPPAARSVPPEVSDAPSGALLLSRTANPLNMQLRFSVGPSRHWRLQASEDLVHWTTLCGIDALTNGWINVLDPAIRFLPARFYRLVGVPISSSNGVTFVPPDALSLAKTADARNVQLRFSVSPNRHWQLQATEDFRNWTILCELDTFTSGWIDVLDPLIPARSARFYRLASEPLAP